MEFRLVYITTGNKEEAIKIGKQLLADRLAACVNIIEQMNSSYWWEGKIQNDQEAILIAKTKASLMPELIAKVRELHSYQVPCTVALPILEGNQDYLDWIKQETK